MDAWIGIDPGMKGAIALIAPKDKVIKFISNSEQPHSIYYWLEDITNNFNIMMTCIEDVHAIYGTSAKSNFNFGFNTGLVTGIVQSIGLPLAKVPPKKWQKTIGVTAKGKAIKQQVGKIAQELYPTASLRGARGGLLDGKSDALMIAHYSYLTYR